MATLKTIAEAIQHVDEKKENLKKAFDDLQARSFFLSSFPFSWSDIDSHFTSIQNSVSGRFHRLQSLDSSRELGSVPESKATGCSSSPLSPKNEDPSTPNAALGEFRADSAPETQKRVGFAVPRQELREFCERMDGKGLILYINEHGEEREAIRVELPGALRGAPDPGALVLDAVLGFFGEKRMNDRNWEVSDLRRVCMLILEQLMEIRANFSDEVRERAKKLALEWKGKLRSSGDLAHLGFLLLVATYGLGSEFDKGELFGCFYVAAKYQQGVPLCRAIGIGDNVHGLVQRLLNNGKQLLSVGFIVEFGLTEKFPLVPILNAHLDEVKKNAKKLCEDGRNTLKSQNIAAEKEVVAMNQVIKVIKEQKLETKYPPEALQKRIVQLEKQIENRKRLLSAPAAKSQQQDKRKAKQHQRGNKRSRISGPRGHPAGASSTIYSRQRSHLRPAGLLATGQYASAAASYVVSSAGLYGIPGASMEVLRNSNLDLSHLFSSSESQIPSSYGGSNLPPQFHSSYHPQ